MAKEQVKATFTYQAFNMWDAGAIAIGLTYSKMLTDRFSIGVTGKYIRESIWNSSSSGFGWTSGIYNNNTLAAIILIRSNAF